MSRFDLAAGSNSSLISFSSRNINSDHFQSQQMVIPPRSNFKLNTDQLLRLHRNHKRLYRSQLSHHGDERKDLLNRSVGQLVAWNDLQLSLPLVQARQAAEEEAVTDFAASRIKSKLATSFIIGKDPFQKTREFIEKDLRRKLARQLRLIDPKTNQDEFLEVSTILGGSQLLSKTKKIRESLLEKITSERGSEFEQSKQSSTSQQKFQRNLKRSKIQFKIDDEEVQAVYDDYKYRMRVQKMKLNVFEVKDLSKVDLQQHKDKGGQVIDDSGHLDRLKFLRYLNSNVQGLSMRDIIQLKSADRSSNETFYFRMYLQHHLPFFSHYDRQTMSNLCRFMVQKVFEVGETIYELGEASLDMFIVLFGEVQIHQDGISTVLKSENSIFGEGALEYDPLPRASKVTASKQTICLSLSNKAYFQQVYHIEHKKKLQRLDFLSNIDILRSWSHERTTDFNLVLKQRNLDVNEIIYSIGDLPEYLYILKSGILSIKTRLGWTDENKFPTGIGKWEVYSTERIFEYELLHLEEGDIFGQQELIEHFQRQKDIEVEPELKLLPPVTRLTEVQAVTPSTIIQLPMSFFQQYLGPAEIKKMNTNLFQYNKDLAMAQVKTLIKKQKFQNEALSTAAARQVETCPFNAETSTQQQRKQRTQKLKTWIEKSKNDPMQKQDLPVVSGLGNVRLISRKVFKKQLQKMENGEIITNDMGQVYRGLKPASHSELKSQASSQWRNDFAPFVTKTSQNNDDVTDNGDDFLDEEMS